MEWEDEWTGNTKRDKAGNNYFESTLQYLGKGKVLNRFVSESLLNPAWIQVIDISCFQGLFFFGLPDQIEINRFPNRPSDWQRHHGSHLNGTTPGLWRHGSHVPLRGSFGGAKGPWSSFGGTDGTREDDGWWLEAFIRFWCHTWHNKNINGMAMAFWKKPAIFFWTNIDLTFWASWVVEVCFLLFNFWWGFQHMSTGIASCRRVFFPEFKSTFDPPRLGLNDGAAGCANDSPGARKCQVCHRWDLSVTAYGWWTYPPIVPRPEIKPY